MRGLDERFKEFGKAISANADILAELAELRGEELFLEKVPNTFSALTSLDLVLGNVVEGYAASSLLMELSHALSREESNRRFAPDVEDWLKQVEMRIELYNNAVSVSDEEMRLKRVNEIREFVFRMREGLTNEVRSMEVALNTRFGHVESLKDKQVENKYLIDYLTRLTGKLAILDFKRLSSMSGADPELRKLLSQKLYQTVKDGRDNIIATLPRLQHLLWEFQQQSKETPRVWALYNYFRTGAATLSYEPSDEELEDLCVGCPTEQFERSLSPDIYSDENLMALEKVVAQMKERRQDHVEVQEVVEVSEFGGDAVAEEEAEVVDPIKQHIVLLSEEARFGKVSCMDYWRRNLSEQAHCAGFVMLAHNYFFGDDRYNVVELLEPYSEIDVVRVVTDFTVEVA